MKKYEEYSTLDFVKDDAFRDWVQGNGRDEGFWMHFLQQHPEKRADIRQAELLIRAMNVVPEQLSEKEIRNEVNQFLEKVNSAPEKIHEPTTIEIHRRWWQRSAYQIAATVILLVIAAGAWWMTGSTKKQLAVETKNEINRSLAETVNHTDRPLKLTLDDGSEVRLSPHSRLKYAPKFTGDIREVFLTGEASFEVVKKTQPFLVRTGEVTTKVLGTSFTVRAYETDRRVMVQVRSGKVSVYANHKQTGTSGPVTKGVILTANQAAVFEEKERQLSKTLVVQPILLRPEVILNHFEYDETPLPQVVKQLEQAYGIHFQFDGEVLKNCKITATLSNESLYDKLNLLCKITGATYEIVDGQIIIDAQGCQ
ncbi:FecR family protein [Runella sp.]|uniref:FecR family protein n=1 Tax=Runella sp. TaxID=1960881 RepID=UPI003D11D174